MMATTGCDGVVVGRGCLGRPWLFGDLAAALGGEPRPPARPSLGDVARAFRRHAELLVEFFGDDPDGGEHRGCRDIRKHVAWYFKGYSVGGDLRARLATVESLAQLDELLAELDLDQPYPGEAAEGQRGRAGSPKAPALPDRWLTSRSLDGDGRAALAGAELDTSGG
jgi:tRNA-dihydrouridine synthase